MVLGALWSSASCTVNGLAVRMRMGGWWELVVKVANISYGAANMASNGAKICLPINQHGAADTA